MDKAKQARQHCAKCVAQAGSQLAHFHQAVARRTDQVFHGVTQKTRQAFGEKFDQIKAHVRRQLNGFQRQSCIANTPRTPMFGSLTVQPPLAPQAVPAANPVMDLALSYETIAPRLEAVQVFTVTNSANEFILVSDDQSKQLGLFCFNEKDAAVLLEQVKRKDPSLAKSAKVTALPLDKVYHLASKLPKQVSEGTAFRLLPDAQEVLRTKHGEALLGLRVVGQLPISLRCLDRFARPSRCRRRRARLPTSTSSWVFPSSRLRASPSVQAITGTCRSF